MQNVTCSVCHGAVRADGHAVGEGTMKGESSGVEHEQDEDHLDSRSSLSYTKSLVVLLHQHPIHANTGIN